MSEINTEEIQFSDTLLEFEILKEKTSEDMKPIYVNSRKLELPFLDYMTARDLLELGGYQDDTPLFAILMTIFGVLQEGSLCLDLDKKKLSDRLGTFIQDRKAERIAREFLSGLEKGKYDKLITRNGDDYMPLILDESKDRRLLYFQKYYVYEKSLKARMEALLQAKTSGTVSKKKVEDDIRTLFTPERCIRVSKGGRPITRDRDQIAAIRLALNSQFSIISGGPGTGKTSLMVNIIRCLVRDGIQKEDILLGAPTGRAAQRMTEAVRYSINTIKEPSEKERHLLDLKGSTLHKILKYRGYTHDFYYRDTNPLPASVIILDEVSMVDVVMMERFLRAVDPSRTKLILLGDKDQLPSVEAGAVFAEMIPDGAKAERFKDRLIILKKVYRADMNLLRLAKEMNQGNCPEYTPVSFEAALELKPDKWAFVLTHTVEAWKEHIQLWTQYHYLSSVYDHNRSFKDLISNAGEIDSEQLITSDSGQVILEQIFAVVERARILSLVRKGSYGCVGINYQIGDHLYFQFDDKANNNIFSGAVIMVTRNDYSKELFNGDVGVVLRDPKGTYRAFFPRFGSYISFAVDMLPPWEHAFAMTVHKSQGSEFDDVLLVLPEDEAHRLLTREIVYTGITRAKKRIIIYGKESALATALERKIERQSGLSW